VEYLIDPGIQRRLTGWSVDFLIVSTVASIQLMIVGRFLVPILVISLTNGVLTTLVAVYLGRRVWSYNLERIAAIYGTVTGTVSCGLLLLRIVDPEFKTPVAVEIGVMNVIALPVIAGYLLLLNAPVWWDWSIGFTVLVLCGIMAVVLAALRISRLWGSPRF
jgi:ESS family glutamate:Na+ symporter